MYMHIKIVYPEPIVSEDKQAILIESIRQKFIIVKAKRVSVACIILLTDEFDITCI